MTSRFGKSFQRFLHNFAAYGVGQVINIITQIFAIPVFLHYWSKQEYGEWLVLTSIPSLLWTFDNGLAGLASSRMTVVSAKGDWAEANQIFRTVMLVQNALGACILLGTGLFVTVYNTKTLFGFTLLSRQEAGAVLMVMIGYLLLGFQVGFLRAAYRASMQEARAVMMTNLWRLSDFVALVVILPCGGHAVNLACGLLCSIALWVVVMFIDVRRRCPNVEFSFGVVSSQQVWATIRDGLPIMAGVGAGALFLQGYPLMVNRLLGPAAVVTLTTLRTASRTMFQGVTMVSMASSSELSRSYGHKDWDSYLRLLKVLVAVTIWMALAVGLALTLYGPWAIDKWTSGKVLVGHPIMFLFALSVAFQCGWSACSYSLVSTNMHHSFNYTYLGLTLAGLFGVSWAVHAFGFLGVPTTMVLVDGFLLAWGLHVCRTRLTFIPLRSLGVIFQPSYYVNKMGLLLGRA